MFTKVLIANRGEIAVRVQQTLQAMGVATVAVYSEADASAPHVAMADEAYPLGGTSAEESYLDIAKLLEVARRSGAEAVHPGYGFLSERPEFARACRDAELVFIGPTPESMEALGDKVKSKAIARRVGVPVVPSSSVVEGVGALGRPQGAAPTPVNAEVETFIRGQGFPLLVKAAAGGGGRGMRVVHREEELPEALEAASQEARAAFGDGRVFLERYVPRPRHVEFQVLADAQGSVIHLMERECSVQRRHQKVVEETPSCALTAELRRRMGEAAVALARAAGYVNAGTAEFLVDSERGEFYFLEMNTRLQVEHPITEAVLGLDLVELQARIAAGDRLPLGQGDVEPRGHAVECRIYAEDFANGYVPSVGRLLRWRPPGGPGMRLDSGVVEGQEVTAYYDPMLAKLIVWGPTRELSLRRMEEALRRFVVLGVVTNIPALRSIVAHEAFRRGEYHTGFLEEHAEVLRPAVTAEAREVARALGAVGMGVGGAGREDRRGAPGVANVDRSPWGAVGGWRG